MQMGWVEWVKLVEVLSKPKYLKMLIVLLEIVDGMEFNSEMLKKCINVMILFGKQNILSKRTVAIGSCNLWGLSNAHHIQDLSNLKFFFVNEFFFHSITNKCDVCWLHCTLK